MQETHLTENPGDFHRRKNLQAYEKYVVESDKQIRNCTLR